MLKEGVFAEERGLWTYFDLKVYFCVILLQEWRSVKSRENKPLSMPEEPKMGRPSVRRVFYLICHNKMYLADSHLLIV